MIYDPRPKSVIESELNDYAKRFYSQNIRPKLSALSSFGDSFTPTNLFGNIYNPNLPIKLKTVFKDLFLNGVHYPLSGKNFVSFWQSAKKKLSAAVHEAASHGTDDLIPENVIEFYEDAIRALPDKHKIARKILGSKYSNYWYELRATKNELESYLKENGISIDDLSDREIMDHMKRLGAYGMDYNLDLGNLLSRNLENNFGDINSYPGLIIDPSYLGNFNTPYRRSSIPFMDRLRYAVKYLPAVTGVGLGISALGNTNSNGGYLNNPLLKKLFLGGGDLEDTPVASISIEDNPNLKEIQTVSDQSNLSSDEKVIKHYREQAAQFREKGDTRRADKMERLASAEEENLKKYGSRHRPTPPRKPGYTPPEKPVSTEYIPTRDRLAYDTFMESVEDQISNQIDPDALAAWEEAQQQREELESGYMKDQKSLFEKWLSAAELAIGLAGVSDYATGKLAGSSTFARKFPTISNYVNRSRPLFNATNNIRDVVSSAIDATQAVMGNNPIVNSLQAAASGIAAIPDRIVDVIVPAKIAKRVKAAQGKITLGNSIIDILSNL